MSAAPSVVRYAIGSVHLLAGSILLCISGAFLAGTSFALVQERAYQSGRTADATIVSKQLRPATSNSSSSYELTYRVRRPEGGERDQTESVDPAIWEAVERGGTVRVQYLAGDATYRVARDSQETFLTIVVAAMAPLALLGLGLTYRGTRSVLRKVRISRHGHLTEATVTAVHETNVRVNRQTQWAIDFTYRDRVGQAQHGSSAPMPASEALEFQEGDKAFVRFDPDRPEDSVWIGKSAQPVP